MTAHVDLHVHSGRYSQCAETLDPYRLGEAAKAAGLHGLILTEHDLMWQDEELELLRESCPEVRIYRGIEVSAAGCHLVLVGLDDAGPFHRHIPPDEAIDLAHASGAAVILAHPYRDADPTTLPVGRVDAVEVDSTSVTAEEAAAALVLAELHAKPAVAASDAHALKFVGWAYTDFPTLPADEAELAAAIRSGAGIPRSPTRSR